MPQCLSTQSTIRPLQQTDVDAVADLADKLSKFAPVPWPPIDREKLSRQIESTRTLFTVFNRVCLIDGEMVGVIFGGITDTPFDWTEAALGGLISDSSKPLIGLRLFRKFLAWADEIGADEVTVVNDCLLQEAKFIQVLTKRYGFKQCANVLNKLSNNRR